MNSKMINFIKQSIIIKDLYFKILDYFHFVLILLKNRNVALSGVVNDFEDANILPLVQPWINILPNYFVFYGLVELVNFNHVCFSGFVSD